MTAAVNTRVPFWRNIRVLQWVVQLVVVGAVIALIWWLYNNYTENVGRQNIPTNFDFLDNPANFQITGNSLSQNAPVRDALYEGVLNTLRVSVVGIILATMLGTIIGIGRLSNNWLIRKIATVYVEAVRNVPLALFLIAGLLIVVLGVFPTIQEAWDLAGLVIISNRGIAIPWFQGGSGLLLVVLFFVGIAVWWGLGKWRESVSDRTGGSAHAARWGIGGFALVFFGGWFLFGYSVTSPELAGRKTEGGMRIDPSFFALLFALVIYTASHIAEIVRGSIQAVPLGQGEAADAVALSRSQRMWYIILPQAFRIGIPPIGNQYLNLIKNSSLGAAIGYYDITLVAQTTVGNGSPAVPVFALTMAMYITLSLITSFFVNLANRRMALVER
ncbi:MAG: ABC transporter permease subunit [Acidimicrobiia bacterium]|nr:ABC transporter permease subunit [Acidimicrobiia bacterium]